MSVLYATDKEATYIKVDNDVYDHFILFDIEVVIRDRVPMVYRIGSEQTLLSYIFTSADLINTKPKFKSKNNTLIYDYTSDNLVLDCGYAFIEPKTDLMSELCDKIIFEEDDPVEFVDKLKDMIVSSTVDSTNNKRKSELLNLICIAENEIIERYKDNLAIKCHIDGRINDYQEELESLD